MSIRHAGNRWYNISEDGGETWQPTTSTWYDITAPACNGDMIRYTSENQGHDKNRLLHSVPYGNSRTDVTVYVSYDEGETWPVKKCIVPYSSAYSSLCILPDGTIGLYVEEAYAGAPRAIRRCSTTSASNGSPMVTILLIRREWLKIKYKRSR